MQNALKLLAVLRFSSKAKKKDWKLSYFSVIYSENFQLFTSTMISFEEGGKIKKLFLWPRFSFYSKGDTFFINKEGEDFANSILESSREKNFHSFFKAMECICIPKKGPL